MPGSFVEQKSSGIAWHYRQGEPVSSARTAARLLAELLASERPGAPQAFDVLPGDMVLEVKPRGVNKGNVVPACLATAPPGASVLAVGDDRTDEDAFRELREAWPLVVTIRVAAEVVETAAEFCVTDTDAVRELLQAVVALRKESRAA